MIYSVCRHPRSRGFTLIELMICISIILILAGLGANGIPGFLQRKAESTAIDTLFHLVAFARNKAIREHKVLTLCASDDDVHCTGEWNRKIMVFEDDNQNAQREQREALLRIVTMRDNIPCLSWNASLHRNYLRFKPDGTSAGTAGNFHFCQPDKALVRKKLVISLTGRTAMRNL